MRRSVNPGGIVIALLGFVLTRATVTFTVANTFTAFLVGGVVPLVLGLSLSAFGVILTVGAFEPAFVRTVARWTVMGIGFIGALVLVSVFGVGRGLLGRGEASTLFSNVLIGGSVGGALTGIYAARNRTYQRELLYRQNRLVILNRLLLDEVMNAVTVIKGSVPLLKEKTGPDVSLTDAIQGKAEQIEDVMSVVRSLAEPNREMTVESVGVAGIVDAALDRAREQYPGVSFSAGHVPADVFVRAHPRLADALFRLLADGAEHAGGESPHMRVDVEIRSEGVVISVVEKERVLSDYEREALERGTTIAEDGDLTTNLGFYMVRLLVQAVRGGLEVEEEKGKTRISIILDRKAGEEASAEDPILGSSDRAVGARELSNVALVALFAGGVMGGYVHLTAETIPVIGALYGTESILVGLVTHEFHSVVFGLVYSAFLTGLPHGYTRRWRRVGVSVTWAMLLWLVASGIVMPVWLNLMGVEAAVPKLGIHNLTSHLIWGVTLGVGDWAVHSARSLSKEGE